jgi:hypothetical protein
LHRPQGGGHRAFQQHELGRPRFGKQFHLQPHWPFCGRQSCVR